MCRKREVVHQWRRRRRRRRRRRQESLVCLAALDVFWNVAACSSER